MTPDQTVPWFQTVPPEYVTAKELSGIGYAPDVTMDKSSDFDTCARSLTRTESLAFDEYPPMERKPIVPRIASMVITTISSTRVNHFSLLKEKDFFDLAMDYEVKNINYYQRQYGAYYTRVKKKRTYSKIQYRKCNEFSLSVFFIFA